MALSEAQRTEVTGRLVAFCESRVPVRVRDKVRLSFSIEHNEVILFEVRPAFLPPHEWRELPIAKFRYVGTQKVWRLYCQRRDLRWHEYDDLPEASDFADLLDEVDADPTGI